MSCWECLCAYFFMSWWHLSISGFVKIVTPPSRKEVFNQNEHCNEE